MKYPLNPEIDYLLGAEYAMLKHFFWDSPERYPKENIKTLMITLGINDHYNLTPKLVDFLNRKLPNLQKKVIIGKYFQNIEEIKKREGGNCELIYFPDGEGMKNIMLSSDIAITAGGQTSYELLSLNVPPIIIAVVNNQINSAKKLNNIGIALYSGWWENKDLFKNILKNIQKLKNFDVRNRMINLIKKYVKPDGSRRIIGFITKQIN